MSLNFERTRALLQSLDFKALFIEEFGWDRYTTTLDVSIDGQNYALRAIAEKRGMVASFCEPAIDGSIPDHPIRRKKNTWNSGKGYRETSKRSID